MQGGRALGHGGKCWLPVPTRRPASSTPGLWAALATQIEGDAEAKMALDWVREMYAFSVAAALEHVQLDLQARVCVGGGRGRTRRWGVLGGA